MQHNIKSVIITLLIGIILPTASIAHEIAGMPVESDGGLKVGSPSGPYWFQLGGVIKLDHRSFIGKTDGSPGAFPLSKSGKPPGTYFSGAFVRALELDLSGGIGNDFTYSVGLDFDTHEKEVALDFAFVTYNGFKHIAPNFSFSVGQVFPAFCISCASSSKWIPFMERNMGTNVFGPKQGLGVSANSYRNDYSATIAITQQPKMGSHVKALDGSNLKTRDLWQASGRFTYAPIAEEHKLLQLGFSTHIQEYSNTGLEFKANPEMKTNHATTLLNTSYATAPGAAVLISAKNQKTIDFELTGLHGPWSGELEYQRAYVKRGLNLANVSQGPNLTFYGYHAQVSYVLTGESRTVKKSNGTLGPIKPSSKNGAWEISGRYSVINLNNKDISGGKANNTTASLSWYANNNVRVIGEYVISKQSRKFPTYLDKRTVSGIGARLQVVF